MNARVNLFTFVMNPNWASHPHVKYVERWLPENLRYTGAVLRPVTVFSAAVAPPSPESHVFESTVQIVELRDDALTPEDIARMRAEMAAATPSNAIDDGMTASDEEALLELAPRGRTTDEEAAAAAYAKRRRRN